LLMVVIAAGIVFVMVLSFAIASGLSVCTSGNISNRNTARAIAESGLRLASAYVLANSDWRTQKTPGTWVQDQPLNGGTFTVVGQAGEDTNGDGVVEGSGSFTTSTTSPVTLTATAVYRGSKWVSQTVLTPSVGGVAAGAIVNTTVTVSGSSFIDSFDSTLGDYGGGNTSRHAHVATNSTAAGAVNISGSGMIYGDVQAGPGANVSKTVKIDNSGSRCTGTVTALAASNVMPTITVPDIGAAQGATTYSNGITKTLSSNLHTSKLTIGYSTINISGDVIIVTDGNFSISSGAKINVLANSSLKLYCKGTMSISYAANVVTGANLSRLTFYNVGTKTVTLSSGGSFEGVLVSPNAPVSITGNYNLYGAVIAQSLSITSGAFFHEDLRITNSVDPVAMPGSGSTGQCTVRWVK
jgi:cytoskeletal protein CcmA (bactofilin family)